MPDRRTDPTPQGPGGPVESPEAQKHEGGYEGAGPEYGRGYGRDFGGAGLNQGFEGSWGQGYGGGVALSDYRRAVRGQPFHGLASGAPYDASFGREEPLGPADRSWFDRCADDEAAGQGHHRGRGPKDWSRDDRRVYEEICERLLHDRLIDARGIEVEVENGVVTLRGEARAASDPALAERLIRETPGVRGVELQLKVRPGPPEPEPKKPAEERIDKSPLGYPILPT